MVNLTGMSEFGVHGVEGNDDVRSVIGRCFSGALQVGRVFLSSRAPDGVSHPVRLAIVRIQAYQRDLDKIEEGLTARLHIQGEGLGLVHAGTILNTAENHYPTTEAKSTTGPQPG
jgi:hypothetical protein